jgi:hypothetical protein
MWALACMRCFGLAASVNGARVAWRMWRNGNMDDMCDAMGIGCLAAPLLAMVTSGSLWRNSPVSCGAAPSLARAAAVAVCATGAITLVSMTIPRVVTRLLVKRALQRRFDTLKEGEAIVVGMMSHESVLMCRHEEISLFIVVFAADDILVTELTRDEFVNVAARTRGLWAVLASSRRMWRSRAELVAVVRGEASHAEHSMYFRERLAIAAWKLERPARIIQRAMRRALSDPGFLMCRRRLQREWHQLASDCSGM